MTTDPIADMIVRIKNAGDAHIPRVVFGHSKIKEAICKLLEKEGFITNVKVIGDSRKSIRADIVYVSDRPRIRGVRRVSKPSRRIYCASKDIKPVRNGYGLAVLSTPTGILSGEDARKGKVGGELMFQIW